MIELDYLVLKYLYREKKALKVGKIAKNLNLPHSTMGSCVSRLKDQGYVLYKAYGYASLTDKGKNLAKELIRHTQLMELLLVNSLGLSIEKAHEESEKINFLFSCDTINLICEKYDHPKECPCGEKILNSSKCFCKKSQ
jgi:DtxR family Mn-dependent transcriptional regulator